MTTSTIRRSNAVAAVLAPGLWFLRCVRRVVAQVHEAHCVLAELEQYSDTELGDLGLRRNDLARVAAAASLLSLSGH
jgi:uncharacterized protein YjiS (DUF1127 family)